MRNYLDLNIIGIAETHLLSGQVIEIDGYSWFGNNRNDIQCWQRKILGALGF